uniref:Uncharacterized protein n=1 Tax=Rhizophora mucronata TaxID=61149 RepID=A0A2P2KCM7_RHIMU
MVYGPQSSDFLGSLLSASIVLSIIYPISPSLIYTSVAIFAFILD